MKERLETIGFEGYEKKYIIEKKLYNLIPLYTLGILEYLYEESFLGKKSYSECKDYLQNVDFNFQIEDIEVLEQTYQFFREHNLKYPKSDLESILLFYQSIGFFEVLEDKVYFLEMSDVEGLI